MFVLICNVFGYYINELNSNCLYYLKWLQFYVCPPFFGYTMTSYSQQKLIGLLDKHLFYIPSKPPSSTSKLAFCPFTCGHAHSNLRFYHLKIWFNPLILLVYDQPTFTLNFSKGQYTSHNMSITNIVQVLLEKVVYRCFIRLRKDSPTTYIFT